MPAGKEEPTMTATPDDFLEATRIADIDPLLGIERRRRGGDLDATVIGAPLGRPTAPKKTAQFIPTLSPKSPDEPTAVWKDGARAGTVPSVRARLLAFAHRVRPSKPSLRVAVLSAFALTAASLAVFGLPRERPPVPRPPAVSAAAPPPPSAAAEKREKKAPLLEVAPELETIPARNVQLVDALADGRIEDARKLCASLSKRFPEDAALRATAEILALDSESGAP